MSGHAPRRPRPFVPGAPVFRAGGQLRKVRFVVPLVLVSAAAMLWLAWTVFESYGLAPSEGGVLKPLAYRGALASLFLAMGVGSGVPASFHHGVYRTHRMSVSAPWFGVRLPGRRFPLIVDVQGEVLDREAFQRLVG